MSGSFWPHGLQYTKLPCPSLSPRVCSNSSLLSQWCRPTVSFSAGSSSSCPQSFSASGSFPIKIVLLHCATKWLFSVYSRELFFPILTGSDFSNLMSVKALLSYSCKLEIGIVLHSLKWDFRALQFLKPQRFPFPGGTWKNN